MNTPGLSEFFQQFLTRERLERFDEVLNWRTRRVQVVLVDLFQQHNASAVLRSCDALGVQNVHIVESYNRFAANDDIALGSEQWLTLQYYTGQQAVTDCIGSLKSQGIQVAATTLHTDSLLIDDIPLDRPVAVMFGNEHTGLPDEAIEAADYLVHLPMYGFVESYNVSVAAALCMQTLTGRLRSSREDWHLTQEERSDILSDWARKSLRKRDAFEREFRRQTRKRESGSH